MSKGIETLAERLAARISEGRPGTDIVEGEPGLGIDDAYRVQFALMRRLAAAGDRVVGYKAAYTSKAMRDAAGFSEPVVGTLLGSGSFGEDTVIRLAPDTRTLVEPEVAVLLKRDLAGPGVTITDVLGATEGLLPAIEVVMGPTGAARPSPPAYVATQKTTGGIVVGGPIRAAHGIDLRLEGCVLGVNGKARGSGTAVEVMGNPLLVVAMIANTLAGFGQSLRAGMILMTGSIVAAVPVAPGDDVRVEFTRLGAVSARFAA